MESRSAKLLCSSAGGSASSHAQKYRVGLPSAWVKAMALSPDSPELELTFENDTITIRKRSAQIPEDFMRSARIDRHQVKIYRATITQTHYAARSMPTLPLVWCPSRITPTSSFTGHSAVISPPLGRTS